MRALAGAVAALVVAGSLGMATASPAAGSNGGSGSCDPYVDGTVIPVPCSAGASTGAAGGSGSGGGPGWSTVSYRCSLAALGEAQAKNLGLSWPPPQGKHWGLMNCLGGATGVGPRAFLVGNGTGAPQVTPQQLLVRAFGELYVPYLRPGTAPPRGSYGLVGLPEWFWVPAGEW